MGGILWLTEKLSRVLNGIALCALTFIMLLTVSDVVLRFFGHPIVGTFEVVGFCGAVVIGFALPLTTWERGHIFVDFLTQKMSKAAKKWMDLSTRVLCIVLFAVVGWNLFIYSHKLMHLRGSFTDHPVTLLSFFLWRGRLLLPAVLCPGWRYRQDLWRYL